MYKSKIRNSKDRVHKQIKKEKFIMEEEYEYGFVNQMMGNGRCVIYCEDGKERLGRIRGSMRKYRAKVIISTNDLIALTRREYEEDKVDIIHKFTFEEASHLLNKHKLPEMITKRMEKEQILNAGGNVGNDLDHIIFDHEDEHGVNDINSDDSINIVEI